MKNVVYGTVYDRPHQELELDRLVKMVRLFKDVDELVQLAQNPEVYRLWWLAKERYAKEEV